MIYSRYAVHQYDNKTGQYIQSFKSANECEKTLSLYRGAIKDAINRKTVTGKLLVSRVKYDIHPAFTNGQPKEEKKALLSEQELREKHDMFFQIKTYLGRIKDGSYIDESSLLRELGLFGKPRCKEIISRTELKEHKGKVDGVTYYGSVNSIKKLKQEGVLQ